MTYPRRLTAQLLLIAMVAGCGNVFEPIFTPVPGPEEVVLHDFNTGSLLDPAAFNLFDRSAVRTDQSTGWDFVFAVDPVLGPTLQPREFVVVEESDAGIQPSESEFDALIQAPNDGYTQNEPVPVAVGSVFTVRSRQAPGLNSRCRVFGKIEIVSIEGVPAMATIRYVINPNCERRNIEPEDQ
ncbi:MAG: hypothetical protein E4H28_04865 [Gemmatimonadales bacterium]|nr:MAG: hypothetical protein E4H28_04865 [Gemmatimonadales bacterium]